MGQGLALPHPPTLALLLLLLTPTTPTVTLGTLCLPLGFTPVVEGFDEGLWCLG